MRVISFIIAIIAVYGFGYQDEYAIIAQQQRDSFNIDAFVQEFVDSVKNEDASVVENNMCQTIKNDVADLPNKIVELMNAIPGEIISWEREFGGISISKNDGYGGILQEKSYDILLNTTEGEYKLILYWSIVNTCYPQETGIRSICILDPQVLQDACVMAVISTGKESPHSNPNPPTVREDREKMIKYIISCLKEQK